VEAPLSPLDASRFSLLNSKLAMPPLAVSDGGVAPVPIASTDPRYAEYFADIKKRIEDKWVYPTQATQQGQSGKGEVQFVLRRDGSLKAVETVKSSGVKPLDQHIERAIRLAAPFPPIPAFVDGDVLPISINFTYTLGRGGFPAP
jgi:TonB family protein